MIKYKIILLINLLYTVVGCQPSINSGKSALNGDNTEINELPTPIPLNGKRLPNDLIGENALYIKDSLFIYYCSQDQEHLLKFLSKNSNQVIGEFLKQGRGPNEYMNLNSHGQFLKDSTGNKLVLYDNILKKISLLNINQSLLQNRPIIENLKAPIYEMLECFYFNDTTYIIHSYMENYYKQHTFNPLNGNTNHLKPLLKKPLPLNDIFLCSSVSQIKPDKSCIAIAYTHFNQLQLLPTEQGKSITISLGKPLSKEYILRMSREDIPIIFGSCQVTDKQIWVLYRNSTRKQWEYGKEDCQLLVFNWQGTPLYRFQLDQSLATFNLDEQNKKLYGIGRGEQDDTYSYDIGSYLQ